MTTISVRETRTLDLTIGDVGLRSYNGKIRVRVIYKLGDQVFDASRDNVSELADFFAERNDLTTGQRQKIKFAIEAKLRMAVKGLFA